MNMIEIELPDGNILEVPEGTPQEDIMSAINRLQETPATPTPTPTAPDMGTPADIPQPEMPVEVPETAPTGRRRRRPQPAEPAIEAGFEAGFAAPYDAAGLQAEMDRGVAPSRLVDTLIRQGATTLQVGDEPFDLVGAREAGVDDREIMHILTTGRPFMDVGGGMSGQMRALGIGANSTLAQLAGAPVDAINNAPRLLNLIPGVDGIGPISDRPFLGSEMIRDGMGAVGIDTYDDYRDLPPDFRPAGVAGEVIGGGALLGAGLTGAAIRSAPAAANSSFARRAVEPIAASVRNQPVRASLLEASSIIGAAQGAAVAEFVFPDNPIVRMGAEFLGGVASPVAIAARTGSGAASGIDRFISTNFAGEAGKQRAARNAILRALNELGEDPQEIVTLLNRYLDNPVEGINLTSGQASGSPALLAVENAIGRKSQQFLGYQQDTIETAFVALRQAADSIAAEGSPEALRIAARMRERYFNDLISSRIAVAQREADLATSRFADADGTDASVRAARIMDEALEDVRAIERSLWEQIPRDTPLTGENTIDALDSLRATLLQEESAPGLAEAFVRRIAGDSEDGLMAGLSGDEAAIARLLGVPEGLDTGGTNAGEILRFRNRMLALGRDAGARGERDLARQFNMMADGALADLNAIDLPEAVTARDFSRELNKAFGSQTVDRLSATTRRGADVVSPDETLDQAFGAGRRRGNRRVREMEDATRFADDATETFRGSVPDSTTALTGGVAPDSSRFNVNTQDSSDIFGAGSQTIRYTDPDSSGFIEIVVRPDGSASVLGLEVPDAFQGRGIGQSLQEQVMADFPVMQGQVSSKAAATTAYRLGRRPAGMPEASLSDVHRMIDENSSVNLVSPEMAAMRGDVARTAATPRTDALQDSVDEYLRSVVDDLVDPVTGTLSEARVSRFIQRNPDILERYPNLRNDLEAAASASGNVRATEQAADQARSAIGDRAVFSRLVNDEDPSRVVGNVLTGNRPEAEFTQMARLAQRSGDDAVRGLEAATMDYATSRATGADGRFNFGTFRETLTRPVNARSKSPIEMMVDNGVMRQEDADRLVTILDEATRLMDVQATRARIDPSVIDEPSSALFDFSQRLVGAQLGSASVAGNLSGSSLVVAGAGSRAVRRIADRVPRAKTLDALVAISKDPQAMRDLLMEAPTAQQVIARDRRLNAFLLQQGIIDITEDDGFPSEIPMDETERMLQEEAR